MNNVTIVCNKCGYVNTDVIPILSKHNEGILRCNLCGFILALFTTGENE